MERSRIGLRERLFPAVLTVAAWTLIGQTAWAVGERNTVRFLAEVAPAYDDNAFEMPENEIDGGFLHTGLEFDYAHRFGPRTRFFAEAEGEGDWYESGLSDANEWSADFRIGARFTPFRKGDRRFRMTPELRYRRRDKTFVSRRTGLEFAGLGDRFDYEMIDASLDLEYRFAPRVTGFLDLRYREKDYLEDFESLILVDSLDYEDLRAVPGVKLGLGEEFTLTVSGEIRLKEYDERFPRAQDGTPVFPFFPPGASLKPFEPREYSYRGAGLEGEWEVNDRWEIEGGYTFTHREDEFLGYMDYREQDARLGLRGRLGSRFTLSFNASYEDRDYDAARTFFDPTNPIKKTEEFFFGSRFTSRLGDNLRLFAFLRYEDRDDRTSLFDYTDTQAGGGILLRLPGKESSRQEKKSSPDS